MYNHFSFQYRFRYFLIILGGILVLAPNITADVNGISLNVPARLHHLEKAGENFYKITGEDPYWVYLIEQFPSDFAGFLVKVNANLNRQCAYQLFWQTADAGFSEHRSFRFGNDTTMAGTGEFYIPCSALAQLEKITAIRLDSENCDTDRVGIEGITLRTEQNVSADMSDIVPKDLESPVFPLPIKAHIQEKGPWEAHDMRSLSKNRYQITGGDPYIVSPLLNVALKKARGVYFKLRLPHFGKKIKFQLFWSTCSRGYSARDNYVFWDTSTSDVFEFFVPFTNLPQDQLLRTVRLDFPVCEDCNIEILDGRIIDTQTDEMESLLPNLITYRLWNSVFETSIPQDIAKRMRQDLPFLIFHALLVFFIAGMFIIVVFIAKFPRD